jgi:hypothetical protein
VGLSVLALQRLATGSWLATSVGEKSLLPNYGPVEAVALASKYGVDVLRGLLLGLYPSEVPIGLSQGYAAFFFPPLASLVRCGGEAAGARFRARGSRWWRSSSRSWGRTSSWASTSTAT